MDMAGLMNPRAAANLGNMRVTCIWAGNSLEGNWQLRPYIAVTARPRASRKGFR